MHTQAFTEICYISVHTWNLPPRYRHFWNLAYLITQKKEKGVAPQVGLMDSHALVSFLELGSFHCCQNVLCKCN